MISAEDKPRLGACIFSFDENQNALFVRRGNEAARVDLQVGREADFWCLRKLLTGDHTVREISDRTHLDIDETLDTIACLAQAGLLVGPDRPADPVDANEFAERLAAAIGMWRAHMLQHELFHVLERKDAPQDVLVGLVLETYHSVAAAPAIIATALSSCRNPSHLRILRDLYATESNHDRIIEKAVNNIGIGSERLVEACPLSSTHALIALKKEIARADSLAFLICFSFSEARHDENRDTLESLRRLAGHYGFPDHALDPIYEHMAMDLEEAHADLLDQALAGAGTIDAVRADDIVNQVHLLKHGFDDYHAGILHYYADPRNSVPPRKVAYSDIF